MKKIIYVILGAAFLSPVMAQNVADAGRFGTTDIAGTARYRSMAGAFGAIGGDATCMTDNPAGIGVYRGTSIFSFSPSLQATRTKTFGNEIQKNKKTDLSVANLSYIISIRPEGTDHLVNFNIGLGLNHSEAVNRKYTSVHDNPRNSFGSYLAVRANNALETIGSWDYPDYLGKSDAWNNSYVPLVALMGYNSYAIDNRVNAAGQSIGGVEAFNDAEGLQSFQRLGVNEKNRYDEYNINLSGNFDDTFYAGLTLSIVDFNSTLISDFYEDYDYNYEGEYTEYLNDLETQGSGVNFKLGMIYRVTDSWRIGAAIHTPTWFDMKDYYNGGMSTSAQVGDYDRDMIYANEDGAYEYRYKYFSPWEYQLSTAYVFGSKAILSLEYDLKDFSSARYKTAHDISGEYAGMNQLIKNNMQKQHTIKMGAEYRVNPHLSLRAGYAKQTSPYSSDLLNDRVAQPDFNQPGRGESWVDNNSAMLDASTKTNYSLLDGTEYLCGGIGWTAGNWFFDFSVMDRIQNEVIAAYPTTKSVTYKNSGTVEFSEGVRADLIDMKTHTMKYDFTIGYKF